MIVDCAHYRDGERQHEGTLPLDVAATCVVGDGDFVWLGLFEPTKEELADVGERFGLHELALEDAYETHQRPKLEDYDDSYFIVLHPARYVDKTEEVEFGEIMLFVSSTYVIAVRHGEASELKGVRKQLESHPELLKAGPAAAVWAILDKVVDDYQPVVDGIDNDIGEVETQIFAERADSTQRIYFLKREVLELRDSLAPLEKPLHDLSDLAIPFVEESTREYFRDVYDHLTRMVETVNRSNDLLASVLSANLTRVGVRQNEDMRKISAWAAILAVPAALAGIYGMNFDSMPELRWRWAYPLVLLVMVAVCVGLHRAFKRSGWL